MLIAPYTGRKARGPILLMLLLAGASSVLYWHIGAQKGDGDLRPYIFVQYYPILALLLSSFFYNKQSTSAKTLLLPLLLYCIAKYFELTDLQIYHATEMLSGHTVKHIFSALTVYTIMAYEKNKQQENNYVFNI
jgi:hypothetical protein